MNTNIAIELTENSHDRDYDLMLFYEFGKANIHDFNNWKLSSTYKRNWKTIEERHAAAKKNQEAAQTKQNTIEKAWGDAGRALIAMRPSNQYIRKLGQLAEQVPEYKNFIKLLNRVLLDRLTILKGKGRSLDPTPGRADLDRALDILRVERKDRKVATNSKESADIIKEISEVTREEADEWGLVFGPYELLVTAVQGSGHVAGTLSEVGTPWARRHQDFILPASDPREPLLDHAMSDLRPADTPGENSVRTSCAEGDDDGILEDVTINKENSSAAPPQQSALPIAESTEASEKTAALLDEVSKRVINVSSGRVPCHVLSFY